MKWFDDLWMKLTGKKKKRKTYTRKNAAVKTAVKRKTKALDIALQKQDESAQATLVPTGDRDFMKGVEQPNGESKWEN